MNSQKKSISLPVEVWNDLTELAGNRNTQTGQLRHCLELGIKAERERRTATAEKELEIETARRRASNAKSASVELLALLNSKVKPSKVELVQLAEIVEAGFR